MAAGANGFLVKPVDRATLADQLKHLDLKGHSQNSVVSSTTGDGTATEPQVQSQPAVELPARVDSNASFLSSKAPTSPDRPIRVMIVDDSVVVRGMVSSLLEEDPEIEVVARAADGRIALEKLSSSQPDVILLDIEMPVMNGFETLQAIRKRDSRLPVIMFSSLTERGAEATLDALMLGANDYVPKPGGTDMRDPQAARLAICRELIPKIKQLAVSTANRPTRSSLAKTTAAHRPALNPQQRIDIVAIGVSTGGPQALDTLLPKIVPDCPVPIVIVQHMPPTFTRHLAARLSLVHAIPVGEGQEGQELLPGQVYLAPGGYHMQVEQGVGKVRIRLNEDPPVNACRPSVDVLFQSVAKAYGSSSLAVILTGMGDDGLRACRQLSERGSRIIAQDERTSVIWGMPGQVARAGLADAVLPLDQIGDEIIRCLRSRRNRSPS